MQDSFRKTGKADKTRNRSKVSIDFSDIGLDLLITMSELKQEIKSEFAGI